MLEIIRIPKGARVSRNMEHGGEIKVVLEYILPKSKYPDDIGQIGKIAEQQAHSTNDLIRESAQEILDEISGLSL